VTAANDYYTVFTVLQQSVPWQERLILPGIILFGIIGAVIAIVQRRRRLSKSFIMLTVFVCAVFLLLAAYAYSAPGVQDMYARAREAYMEGQYATIEGTVTNFHPMPYSGHQNETFSVNGLQFSYSDYVLVPCFNNTSSHGGPIHEGLRANCVFRQLHPEVGSLPESLRRP
jgi:hypothetical protein